MRHLISLLCLCCITINNVWAETITVAAAANMQFTLEDLKGEFAKQTGIDVISVVGASGKLTAQIENGAPFDVFMSADIDYPKRLHNEGLCLSKPKIYAYGALVLWTLKDVDISKGVEGLSADMFQKIAIASPKSAPYGRQAINAMKHEGVYPKIMTKLVYGESIAQTNQFITTRAVDVGFTAKSIVMSGNLKEKGRWVEVNPETYEAIAQAAVVLKNAKGNIANAQKFVEFLFTPTAQKILTRYGYKLP